MLHNEIARLEAGVFEAQSSLTRSSLSQQFWPDVIGCFDEISKLVWKQVFSKHKCHQVLVTVTL